MLARSRKSDRHALKLPRISVVRRLQEMIKHGYVERVGNAYRVTDKVNIPDLQKKLQRRIDMVTETAKRLAKLNAGLGRTAAILQRPSTEQVVLHKPHGLSPLIDQALGRHRKTGFKAACGLSLSQDPVQSCTAMTLEREVSGRPPASALCSGLL